MTTNETRLALANAFLDAEPAAAARLLEQQPLAEVAALLGLAPRSHALRVMDALLPAFAAQVLLSMPESAAAAILSGLPAPKAAVLLRYLTEAQRAPLLQLLAVRERAALRLLLHYSEDQVGAWMQTDVPVLALAATVGAALMGLRQADSGEGGDTLFVIDDSGRLAGCCSLLHCLRSPESTPLRNLLQPPPLPLGGRTGLTTALAHPGWDEADLVPVINRQRLLLGSLSHHRLRRILHRDVEVAERSGSSDLALLITEAYGASLRGLFNGRVTGAGGRSS